MWTLPVVCIALFSVAQTNALPAVSLPQRLLTENDVVLWSESGQVKIMDKTEYHRLRKHQISPGPLKSYPANSASQNTTTVSHSVLERRCDSVSIITMNPDQVFLNWDIPMSSVVLAGTGGTQVSVTPGYQISNSLSVSATSEISGIESFLGLSFGISYDESWTSSYASSYTYTIPAGKYGAIVSNPMTTRKSGHVDKGCVATATNRVEFSGDSYQSKAYGGLSWVDGIISLCTGDQYPLKQCIGDGTISWRRLIICYSNLLFWKIIIGSCAIKLAVPRKEGTTCEVLEYNEIFLESKLFLISEIAFIIQTQYDIRIK